MVFPQATLTGPVTTWTLDVPFGSSLTVVAQAFGNGQAIAIGSLTLPVESGVAPG